MSVKTYSTSPDITLFPAGYPNNYTLLDKPRVFNHSQLNRLVTREYMKSVLNLSASSVLIDYYTFMSKSVDPSLTYFTDSEVCKNNLSVRELQNFIGRFAAKFQKYTTGRYQVYYSIGLVPAYETGGDATATEIILSAKYFPYDRKSACTSYDSTWG